MNKQKLSSVYGLHLDETGNFLSGAILGYCQTHEPEEVAELFNATFNTLPYDKACSIAACISGKMLIVCSAKEEE